MKSLVKKYLPYALVIFAIYLLVPLFFMGKEKGSTTEFKVTLPQDYQDKDLAGKEALYKVTVSNIYIYKIPELSDDFLAGLDKKDDEGNPVDTVDKLKDYFRKQLEAKAQAEHDEALNTVILNYLMEKSTFTREIPAEFTDRMTAAYYVGRDVLAAA